MGGTYTTLVIYGPTVTGKTDLAISLAKHLSGELVSADSRQVYKGLDIGTGKVSPSSRVERHQSYWLVDGIKIHGFDLVKPGGQFTAYDFIHFATNAILKITTSKKLPIIVGGTGFYIKTLLEGNGSVGISANWKLRKELGKLSTQKLYKKLMSVNRQKANSLNESDNKNPRRLIRAIEIALSNQKPETRGHVFAASSNLLIGLTAPNAYIYNRADKWLETRLQLGLIEEVLNLTKSGINKNWLKSLGLEYRWMTCFILGELSKEKAIERLKGDIHSLIRRQKTYFRQFTNMKTFDTSKATFQKEISSYIKKTLGRW